MTEVYLWLTPSEAREHHQALDELVETDDEQRHAHVSASDVQIEILVLNHFFAVPFGAHVRRREAPLEAHGSCRR